MAKKQTEVEMLESEVRKGNSDAYYNLGYIYLLGQGVTKDEKKAISYFRKGTSFQDTKCMQAMAMCYKNGDGVEIDGKMTVYWLNQAVKLNDYNCMYHLGLCYEDGFGVEKNMEEAKNWMEKSSKKNKDARVWLKQHGYIQPNFIERLFGAK